MDIIVMILSLAILSLAILFLLFRRQLKKTIKFLWCRRQKVIFSITALIIVLRLLSLPYIRTGSLRFGETRRIDISRLFVDCLIILIIGGTIYFLVDHKSAKKADK